MKKLIFFIIFLILPAVCLASFNIAPQQPLSERNPNFLPFALIAAVLVLLFLVFKFFQK